MERRRASWIGCALAAALALVGSFIVIGSADIAAAAVSDEDCEVLLNGGSIDSGNSGSDNLEQLADQADEYTALADDISDTKLKKGLRKMAGVYAAASRARNVTAAGIVIAKRSKEWAKGYQVYAKALNHCLASS